MANQGDNHPALPEAQHEPGYPNLQGINTGIQGFVQQPGIYTGEGFSGSVAASGLLPQSEWTSQATTAVRKRQRSDVPEVVRAKRSRTALNTIPMNRESSFEEPWSPLSSRTQPIPEAAPVQRPMAKPMSRKRSRLTRSSPEDSQATLITSTKAEDISKALLSEVKGCKSWEGIQRTIKTGLLNLLKPNNLKALNPDPTDRPPEENDDSKKRKIACEVCGKTVRRNSELKFVHPFLFPLFPISLISSQINIISSISLYGFPIYSGIKSVS